MFINLVILKLNYISLKDKRITKMNTQKISQEFKIRSKDTSIILPNDKGTLFENSEYAPSTSAQKYANKLRALRLKYANFTKTINGFSNLEPNWDSYQADKISKKAIDTAIDALKYLHDKDILSKKMTTNVFPMRDGGIQFEFDGDAICAELEINQYGKLTFLLYDDEGNLIESTQLLELSELLTRL